jgi:tripartite-type tricarboxylate transporter receptor subunit TctC
MLGETTEGDVMLRVFAAALLCIGLVRSVSAQEVYPSRPVKVIAPFAAGGTADVVARFTADRLSRISGQQFVVENRAGASGAIAMEALKRSPKDGYTLIITSGAPVVLLPHIRKTPYDPETDFIPVAMICTTVVGYAVHSSLPVKTFQEFVTYARANKGKLNYASAGVGSNQHIRNEMLSRALDLGLTHVPYKSAGEALSDVLAGQIQVIAEAVVFEHARAGRLRILAVYDTERHPDFPDAPPIGEVTGKPEIALPAWTVVLAPAGTPQPVVDKLNALVAEAMNNDEIKAKMWTQGYRVGTTTSAQASAIIKKDSKLYKAAIEEYGIKAE